MSNFDQLTQQIQELRDVVLSDSLTDKNMEVFTRALLYIDYRIKVSDEFITVPSLIQDVINFISQSKAELNAYIANRGDANFTNAQTNLLNAVRSSSSFVQIQNQYENTYLIDAIKSNDKFLTTLFNAVKKLDGDVKKVQADSTNLINELRENFQKLVDGTETTAGWKKEFTDALGRIEAEFNKELHGDGAEKKGWVAEANEVQSQLSHILKEGEHLGRIIGVSGLTKDQRQENEKSLLRGIKDTCERLLNFIGIGASVGGYQSRANSERISGFIWTAMIVAIFGGLIWFNSDVLEFFEEHMGTDAIYQFLLFRLVTSIPFIAFMTFAGFKAKSHRAMELKYRQFALELAAFEPNLASLAQDVRGFAKLMFIQKTFGNFDESQKSGEVDLDALAKLMNSTKTGIDAVEEMVKKFKKP